MPDAALSACASAKVMTLDALKSYLLNLGSA
jgi:hypothetical protein